MPDDDDSNADFGKEGALLFGGFLVAFGGGTFAHFLVDDLLDDRVACDGNDAMIIAMPMGAKADTYIF